MIREVTNEASENLRRPRKLLRIVVHAEFGVFCNRKLFTLRSPRLGGELSCGSVHLKSQLEDLRGPLLTLLVADFMERELQWEARSARRPQDLLSVFLT